MGWMVYVSLKTNNNLILMSQLRHTLNWCMRHSCLWDKGLPPPNDLASKVYEGIYTLPPSRFKLVKS